MRDGKARHSKGWAGPEDEATCRAQKPSPLVRTTRVVVMRLPNASNWVTCCRMTVLAEADATEPRAARPRTPDTRPLRMIDAVFMTALLWSPVCLGCGIAPCIWNGMVYEARRRTSQCAKAQMTRVG